MKRVKGYEDEPEQELSTTLGHIVTFVEVPEDDRPKIKTRIGFINGIKFVTTKSRKRTTKSPKSKSKQLSPKRGK
jgi:hypothetical protein